MLNYTRLFFLAALTTISGCSADHEPEKGFEVLAPAYSGVSFVNQLNYTEDFNCYTYRNFYNGAGVAIGDINNDGLPDIYFSGNKVDNKLYLNKGKFKFEDITLKAGVACEKVWSTGVSMADINGDGLLDIFVCKSGPPMGGVRHNELFINNGDLTFTESSQAWGVADEGLSIHAVFFDYDRDGDLDFYLLNNSNRKVGIYDLKVGQREVRDPFGGNKLYRNEGNRFLDVSEKAGIYGSAIGFGLGVTVADINKDGWQDIFVSNDFFERDYLYINNRDGSFKEALEGCINEISLGSMGADIADLNNDGYPEIYVTEMLPEQLERMKTKTLFEDWNKYSANIKSGYYRQFSRNVLQLNNGPKPGSRDEVYFSEIGRYSGVHATDWSWGALIFDYNNDGQKDIFVANGIAKDLMDQDYIHFTATATIQSKEAYQDSSLLTRLIDQIPSTPISNYLFENRGQMNFSNQAKELGLDAAGFSNGAAYGDLDNDGDLDLVVSNINEPASLYRNLCIEKQSANANYVQVQFKGQSKNSASFGAQVTVYCDQQIFYAEQSPVKGYLSSVDPRIHLGIGGASKIDSLVVRWPDGLQTSITNLKINQLVTIDQAQSKKTGIFEDRDVVRPFFDDVTLLPFKYAHIGNDFVDFNRHRLLMEMVSNEGQKMAIGDVNGDQYDDIYIGGSSQQAGSLWIQNQGGGFQLSNQPVFRNDKLVEVTDALFCDVNQDGHPDIYVATGGSQYSFQAPELVDRLYINNGKGTFTKADRIVASGDLPESSAFVLALDFNRDGFTDLITGSRQIPFKYGFPADAALLQGDGTGLFQDVTVTGAPDFQKLGLIRDGVTIDYDQDGDDDVIFCGEWMDIQVFNNDNGTFRRGDAMGLANTSGLWNTIETGDFNADGYMDFVVGNQGLNTRYKTSSENPLMMYVHDFDENGSVEQIICQRAQGKDFPLVLLPDLSKQIPSIKKKFLTHESYKDKAMVDLFNPAQLDKAIKLKAEILRSTVFLNQQGRGFEKFDLPWQSQLSKIYAIAIMDINDDKKPDLILGGNQLNAKPEIGIMDATYGITLLGNGDGTFMYVPAAQAGIYLRGEIRDIAKISSGSDSFLFFLPNNDTIRSFKLHVNEN